MSNLNKIFLMGRLTRDPELRYTPQGAAVCELGLAVNREYSTSGGERRKDVLFIDVTLWKRQAEVCAQYLSKGRPIFVEGRLSMDTWEGQDGQKRTKYRVVAENFQFLGGSEGGGDRGEASGQASGGGGRLAASEGPPAESFGPPQEANYGDSYRQPMATPDSYSAKPDQQTNVTEDDIPF